MALPEPRPTFTFGTKAETLARLGPRVSLCSVPRLSWFEVARWRSARAATLTAIAGRFGGATLAVRSSARQEDGGAASLAGAFRSRLHVADGDRAAAVDAVVAALPGRPDDQVLVQAMVSDVAVAGVVASHVLDDGAPYRVVSYDDHSGATDRITGGTGTSKTVWVAHAAPPDFVESPRVRRWVAMLGEVEAIAGGVPLEIEFAEDSAGALWLLQVRRIATTRQWDPTLGVRIDGALAAIAVRVEDLSRRRRGLAGSRTILGEMPDWNPAEMIGTTPAPLARSLYGRLITDRAWRVARARMGYRRLPAGSLVVDVGGRGYVDVRLSCNSFLPAGTPAQRAERLVEAWLDRLDAHPELHDALEFAIVPTVLDFRFDVTFRECYGDLLGRDLPAYRAALRDLTAANLARDTLRAALADVARLAERHRRRGASGTDGSTFPANLEATLAECERHGTVPFAVVARHAFVAEALLRSAVDRGALAAERLADFKASLVLVASALLDDLQAVAAGRLAAPAFHARWGHLRPGTYDIRSRRYDQRAELFDGCVDRSSREPRPAFAPSAAERAGLDRLLDEAGFACDAAGLFDYAATAIAGREWAKLIFTRSLSDGLEAIARFGERHGLGRDDLAHVPLDAIIRAAGGATADVRPRLADRAAEGRAAVDFARALRLGYLVRGVRDVYVAPLHRSAASFVGRGCVEARAVVVDGATTGDDDLRGAIACIEHADPGFDWIFARGIAALVTQYGGSNSHMAIRCAELRLPAALGCGALAFARLVRSARIELDCDARLVRPVHG